MMRVLLSLVLLTMVYALVLASFDARDLLAGIAISGILLLWFRRAPFGKRLDPMPGILRRVYAFIPFAGAVLWDMLVGTWRVALAMLSLRPPQHPGVVAVSIGERTPVGVVVSGLTGTLTPGNFLVDIDWERGVMLFHLLDTSDAEAFRATMQGLYQRYQQYVFP